MRRILKTGPCRQGFTLMEVIVTIIAVGILSTYFVHFMGTALTRASNSVEMVRVESGGEATVEKIIADFVAAMNSDPNTALGAITTGIDNDAYDNGSLGINVLWDYIEFDPSTGNEVITSPTATNTVKITVQVTGNNQVFLLGNSRTATDQPLIRY